MKRLKYLCKCAAIALVGFASCSQQEDMMQYAEVAPMKSTGISSIESTLSSVENLMSKLDGPATRANGRRVSAIQTIEGGIKATDAAVYLVNYENNSGFSVILINNGKSEIYAISNEGHLEPTDTFDNIGLRIFFRGVKDEAKKLSASNSSSDRKIRDFPVVVDTIPQMADTTDLSMDGKWIVTGPLLTNEVSKWSQGFPFNKETPVIGSQHTLVGCSAIACAQAMTYYKPQNIQSQYNYDWNEISSWTLPAGWNDYASLGYAGGLFHLLRHIGDSENLNLQYGLNSTVPIESSNRYIQRTFNNFGLQCLYGDWDHDFPYWDNNLAEECIDSKNIILILGMIKNASYGYPGHLWVADGVMYYSIRVHPSYGGSYGTEDQLFHCVWGWGGKNNGWYKINERILNSTPEKPDNPADGVHPGDCSWLSFFKIYKN